MPGTLVSQPYCGSDPTVSCKRFARTSICTLSVAMTATLLLIASATSAGNAS